MRETNHKIIRWPVTVAGRYTSISLEYEFVASLKEIAGSRGQSLSELIEHVLSGSNHANMSSAVRVFVLNHYRSRS